MHSIRPGTRFDLHLHSTRSDGRYDQRQVLEFCARGGLEVVALTDHDFATDLQPGDHEVDGHLVQVIAGAEITGVHEDTELHLLVYFPASVPEAFRAFCQQQIARRTQRYATAIERLGLPIDGPGDDARAGEKALTRLHLAHALVEGGHAQDTREAFAKHLSHLHGKVPHIDLPFTEAIRIAREAGAITSWAHPSAAHAERWAATFAKAGLHAMEILRPRVVGKDRRTLRRVATKNGLLATGGSDWHGWDAHLQPGLFSVRGYEIQGFIDALRAAA